MALRSTASDGQEEEGEGGRKMVPARALFLGTCAHRAMGGGAISFGRVFTMNTIPHRELEPFLQK